MYFPAKNKINKSKSKSPIRLLLWWSHMAAKIRANVKVETLRADLKLRSRFRENRWIKAKYWDKARSNWTGNKIWWMSFYR